ncbi:MAG: hypothetical protein MJ133_07955 [Lachnospiraceae bacterium]|nr:hypothetical protein [Lachnospiraceae bacterium]
MAIREIAADTDTMQRDITELQEALQRAKDQLKIMFTHVTELDSMWDGPANMEFVKQFGIDNDNCRELFETISSIIECMTMARGEYIKCDNEIGDIIAAISI